MTVTLYGIKNCDSVKKARAWLEDNAVQYSFHDYKTQGVPAHKLEGWLAEFGWENILNKRGTTYRKLSETTKQSLPPLGVESVSAWYLQQDLGTSKMKLPTSLISPLHQTLHFMQLDALRKSLMRRDWMRE